MKQLIEYQSFIANAPLPNPSTSQGQTALTGPFFSRLLSQHRDTPKHFVLVIDDDPTILSLMRRFLKLFGLRSRTFADPRNALIWYSRHWHRVDLVFLDMKNPFLNGEYCFAALQKIHPGVNVALMSGDVEASLINQLLSEGALRFFAKPFDFSGVMRWARGISVHCH